MYRAYYRGALKTELVHKGILPEIHLMASENQFEYVLIGRSALKYYGVSTLTDLIEILFDCKAKETIRTFLGNIPGLKVYGELNGKIAMEYRKIKIHLYFSKAENSAVGSFPYFSEIQIEKESPFPICTIPSFISLSFLQAKLDRSYIPLGHIDTLREKKNLELNSNIHQFESVHTDLKKAISDVFTRVTEIDFI